MLKGLTLRALIHVTQPGLRRLGVAIVIALAAVLAGCSDEASPSTGKVTRVEIAPASVLLPGLGQTHRLKVRAFDSSGREVEAEATWQSSRSDVASVTANGTVEALAEVGSTQIVASVGGIVSAPVFVLVAVPAPGAVLVRDAQILSERIGTNADLMQYEVTLSKDVKGLSPGAIVLAAEAKPLSGRVVATRSGDGGIVTTVEFVPLTSLFEQLFIDEQVVPVLLPQARQGSALTEFEIPPFECEADAALGATVSFSFSMSLEHDFKIDFILDLRDGRLERHKLAVTGALYAVPTGAIEANAAFNAKLECRATFLDVDIPINGALSALLRPAVPIGVGFSVDGSFEIASAKLGMSGKFGASVTAGFDYTRTGGLSPVGSIKPTSEIDATLEYPSSLTEDFRIKGGLGLFGFTGADVKLFPDMPWEKKGNILDITAGPRLELDYGTTAAQAADANYASSYALKLKARAGAGSAINNLLKWLTGDDLTVSLPELATETALGKSPSGSLTSAAGKVHVGDPIDLKVTIKDPDFLVLYNVREVQFYEVQQDGSLTLAHTMPAVQGQTEYTWTWKPVAAEAGDHKFVAFVLPELFDVLPPLEVSDNSAVDVFVQTFERKVEPWLAAGDKVGPSGPLERFRGPPIIAPDGTVCVVAVWKFPAFNQDEGLVCDTGSGPFVALQEPGLRFGDPAGSDPEFHFIDAGPGGVYVKMHNVSASGGSVGKTASVWRSKKPGVDAFAKVIDGCQGDVPARCRWSPTASGVTAIRRTTSAIEINVNGGGWSSLHADGAPLGAGHPIAVDSTGGAWWRTDLEYLSYDRSGTTLLVGAASLAPLVSGTWSSSGANLVVGPWGQLLLGVLDSTSKYQVHWLDAGNGPVTDATIAPIVAQQSFSPGFKGIAGVTGALLEHKNAAGKFVYSYADPSGVTELLVLDGPLPGFEPSVWVGSITSAVSMPTGAFAFLVPGAKNYYYVPGGSLVPIVPPATVLVEGAARTVTGCGMNRRAGGWNGEVGMDCGAEVSPGVNVEVKMLYR